MNNQNLLDELRMVAMYAEKAGLNGWSTEAFKTYSRLRVAQTQDDLNMASNLVVDIKSRLWNIPGNPFSKPKR